MSRARIDALTTVSASLPNAANTVNVNSIDLGAVTPYPVTESVQVKLSITAATGANNKNIYIRLRDSADNTTFANIANVSNPLFVSVDADGGGHAVASGVFSLPANVRRYLQVTALGEADGGDSSDGTFSIALLY